MCASASAGALGYLKNSLASTHCGAARRSSEASATGDAAWHWQALASQLLIILSY